MRTSETIFFLALALTSAAVVCSQQSSGSASQQIPAQCVQNSVTEVSCAQPAPDNLLPHPDDCELFYYCVSEAAAPICRQCPAYLHFNPREHVCDNPETAGCVLASQTAR